MKTEILSLYLSRNKLDNMDMNRYICQIRNRWIWTELTKLLAVVAGNWCTSWCIEKSGVESEPTATWNGCADVWCGPFGAAMLSIVVIHWAVVF